MEGRLVIFGFEWLLVVKILFILYFRPSWWFLAFHAKHRAIKLISSIQSRIIYWTLLKLDCKMWMNKWNRVSEWKVDLIFSAMEGDHHSLIFSRQFYWLIFIKKTSQISFRWFLPIMGFDLISHAYYDW